MCTGRGCHPHLDLAIIGPDDVAWIDRCRRGDDYLEIPGAMHVRDVAVKASVELGGRPRFAPLTELRAVGDRGESITGRRAQSGEIVYLRARDLAVARFRCPHPQCKPVEMTEDALRRCAAMPAGYSMLGPLDASLYAVAGRRYLDRVEEIASRTAARFPDS